VANTRIGVRHVIAMLQTGATFEEIDEEWPVMVPKEELPEFERYGKEINFISQQCCPI
jgi:uncharacterized protein (DUF433 family)